MAIAAPRSPSWAEESPGLSTALHAAEAGADVILLEAHEPGWGASGRNGGQVNPGLKLDPDIVERDFGADLGARMNAFAGGAPAFVFDLIKRHAIRCDARQNGTLRAAITSQRTPPVFVLRIEQWRRRNAPVDYSGRGGGESHHRHRSLPGCDVRPARR